jgi:hypothetical protein
VLVLVATVGVMSGDMVVAVLVDKADVVLADTVVAVLVAMFDLLSIGLVHSNAVGRTDLEKHTARAASA